MKIKFSEENLRYLREQGSDIEKSLNEILDGERKKAKGGSTVTIPFVSPAITYTTTSTYTTSKTSKKGAISPNNTSLNNTLNSTF